MKNRTRVNINLVTAVLLAPQLSLAHNGVENESLLVNGLHSLAHLAESPAGVIVLAMAIGAAGIAYIKRRETKS